MNIESQDNHNMLITTQVTIYGHTVHLITHAISQVHHEFMIQGVHLLGIELSLYLPMKFRKSKGKEFAQIATKYCDDRQIQIRSITVESSAFLSCMQMMVHALGTRPECKHEHNHFKTNKDLELLFIGHVATEGVLRILYQKEWQLQERFASHYLHRLKQETSNIDQTAVIQALLSHSHLSSIHAIVNGGVFSCLWDISLQYNTGFEVDIRKFPILQETIEVCEFYGLNPYMMTSVGAFVIVCEHGDAVVEDLKNRGMTVQTIGKLHETKDKCIHNREEIRYLDRPGMDEYERFLLEN